MECHVFRKVFFFSPNFILSHFLKKFHQIQTKYATHHSNKQKNEYFKFFRFVSDVFYRNFVFSSGQPLNELYHTHCVITHTGFMNCISFVK